MKESNAPVIGRTPFQKWLDKYQGILYLIPWIIGFLVFKAFPFGQSLYYLSLIHISEPTRRS